MDKILSPIDTLPMQSTSTHLSFNQEALLAMHQLNKGALANNLPLTIFLDQAVDITALNFSLQGLVKRHPILHRPVLNSPILQQPPQNPGGINTENRSDSKPITCRVVDVRNKTKAHQKQTLEQLCEQEGNTPFHLSEQAPMRATLLQISGMTKAELLHLADVPESPAASGSSDSNEQSVLLLTIHHMVCDGWSLRTVFQDLSHFYELYRTAASQPEKGEKWEKEEKGESQLWQQQQLAQIAPAEQQYQDYANWQKQQAGSEHWQQQVAFWQEQLSDLAPLMPLPWDNARPTQQSYRSEFVYFAVPPRLRDTLLTFREVQGHTLHTVLLATFQLLLHRYSGLNDIVIGVPVANRQSGNKQNNPDSPDQKNNRAPDFSDAVGYFMNTMTTVAHLQPDLSFEDLLNQTGAFKQQATQHLDVPFSQLLNALNIKSGENYSPLVQVVFTFHNTPLHNQQFLDAYYSFLDGKLAESHLDLRLEMESVNGVLNGRLQYNTSLFKAATIERMAGHFVTLLEQVCQQPTLPVALYDFLSEPERLQIAQWNANVQYNDQGGDHVTAQAISSIACAHHLFEQQAAQTPDTTALIFGSEHMSYGELNRRANQVAHYLLSVFTKMGLNESESGQASWQENVVGLCVERSPEMIIGMLAILKAGGCYLPLDPEYPESRLEYMVDNSGCKVVLSESHLLDNLMFLSEKRTILLDRTLSARLMGEQPTHNPVLAGLSSLSLETQERPATPESTSDKTTADIASQRLCYLIYTSGSTGRPKAVGVQHRGWVNLSLAQQQELQVCTDPNSGMNTRVLQFSSFSFDAAAFEISMSLFCGASLCLLSSIDAKDPQRLTQQLASQQLTHATIPPAMLNHVNASELSVPHTLIVAGEAISVEKAAVWSQNRRLINAYGPTETTVCATKGDYQGLATDIGTPLSNQQCYILDSNGIPTPPGIPGELCVAGAQLARGYLKQGGLTADKFVPNPFAKQPGERLYRTGDLVKYLPSGHIEFIGRIDYQVKVRGFRIELGEIERVLQSHPAIDNALVTLHQGQIAENSKQIVAYVVPHDELHNTEAQDQSQNNLQISLLNHVKQALPDYMVPAAIVILNAFPLTVNGKIDRAKLPEPDESAYARMAYVAPATPMEERLVALWQANLELEKIGVTDNYFELGGDSLRAVSLGATAKEQGIIFSLEDVFTQPTIAQLAQTAIFVSAANTQQTPPGSATNFSLLAAEPAAFSLLTHAEQQRVFAQHPQASLTDAYPLSELQQGMLFHSLHQEALGIYHNVMYFILELDWHEAHFRDAMAHMAQQHPAFRTLFFLENERPLQLIFNEANPDISVINAPCSTPEQERAEIDKWTQEELNIGIDTQQALWRITVHRFSERRLSLGFVVHHALMDGWSDSVFLSDLLQAYHDIHFRQQTPNLPAPPSYNLYVEKEQEFLSSADLQRHWQQQLADAKLPWWSGDKTASNVHLNCPVSAEQSQRLMRLASQLGVQEKSVWCAVYLALLALLDGNNDVLGSVVTHGRPEVTGGDRIIGLFLNSLPLRVNLTDLNWLQLIKHTESALNCAISRYRKFKPKLASTFLPRCSTT